MLFNRTSLTWLCMWDYVKVMGNLNDVCGVHLSWFSLIVVAILSAWDDSEKIVEGILYIKESAARALSCCC